MGRGHCGVSCEVKEGCYGARVIEGSNHLNVRRRVERMGRWRWWGWIEYQGTPEAIDDPDALVPPFTLVLRDSNRGGPTRSARSLARLTRKLDEAEGALHRCVRGD